SVCVSYALFFLRCPRPPTSTLFPYTTLFRSLTFQLTAPLPKRTLIPMLVTPDLLAATGRKVGEAFRISDGAGGITSARVAGVVEDRKSTRLNSSHVKISYAVFCLKKKKEIIS